MDLRKRFGKRIKELRTQAGLKQSELAEMVGIATKTQSCIECGINFPKVQQIEAYAKALNLDISEILYLSETPRVEKDYNEALKNLINQADKKQIELIYRIAVSIMQS